MTNETEWIPIGKIVAAQGLKGELKVYPDSDFPERFTEPGKRWLLRSDQSSPEAVQLVKGRALSHKGLYVIELEGVCDRTQAEALKDSILLVLASDKPHLAPNEYHIQDLVGLSVFEQTTQTHIGTVISLVNAGNDLLEVQLANNPDMQVLIPFVKAIVPVVDLNQHRIEITPPKGLVPGFL
ncbi:ribosome maturation factor RimM [Synechococcales cyanobacterium C]|uniref:Ribosome maturation factor RimM n=1 Tax=Petrachloros mirabilis ULC683 TaxID=2781853 RepID=A0A8K2A6T2_9CYAN|nr:ribosome maturation factor RimM [Petrachloros mirabilis]NCJ06304.1 ribosome maturation factor RimM [Petrachloros mirabilis ULC683]